MVGGSLRVAAVLVGLLAGAGGGPGPHPDGTPKENDGAAASPRQVVERRVYLMGTRATLAVRVGSRDEGHQVLERMLRGLEAVEAELSTWRDDSRLSLKDISPAERAART